MSHTNILKQITDEIRSLKLNHARLGNQLHKFPSKALEVAVSNLEGQLKGLDTAWQIVRHDSQDELPLGRSGAV